MSKKKKSIYEATLKDAAFIGTSDIKTFSVEYIDVFDDALKRLKESLEHPQTEPGLTPLEFTLRMIEREAKKILVKNGYSTDLNELWHMRDKERMFNRYFASTQVVSAREVLFTANNLRDDIANSEAEQTAFDMMRLMYAAINAEMYDVIMTGIRIKAGQPKGGRSGTRAKTKRGIILAIKKVLESEGDLTREKLWRYFEAKHNLIKEQPELEIDDYWIYFQRGRLVQQTLSTGKEVSNRKGSIF